MIHYIRDGIIVCNKVTYTRGMEYTNDEKTVTCKQCKWIMKNV